MADSHKFSLYLLATLCILFGCMAALDAFAYVDLGGWRTKTNTIIGSVMYQEFKTTDWPYLQLDQMYLAGDPGGRLTLCAGEIDAITVGGLWDDRTCPDNSDYISSTMTCSSVATTSALTLLCEFTSPVTLQADTLYHWIYLNPNKAKTDPASIWTSYNNTDVLGDPDTCILQTDYDNNDNDRAFCSFAGTWGVVGNDTYAIPFWFVYGFDWQTIDFSHILETMGSSTHAMATCMETHCYRGENCQVDILYNDPAVGSDLYLNYEFPLMNGGTQTGYTPDNMEYWGALGASTTGVIWDHPELWQQTVQLPTVAMIFGTSTGMNYKRTDPLRFCYYVDKDNDWFQGMAGDPYQVDWMGCDCTVTYANEYSSDAKNKFYNLIMPAECSTSTLPTCGLTDVECGLKKATQWALCPSRSQVDNFYTVMQDRSTMFPYNLVNAYQTTLRKVLIGSTTANMIPLVMIGKNGVRLSDEYLITPGRWNALPADFRYWYFKIIRTLIGLVFLAYVTHRLWVMISGGSIREPDIPSLNERKDIQEARRESEAAKTAYWQAKGRLMPGTRGFTKRD